MAYLVPDVTQIYPASFDAEDVLQAAYSHFSTVSAKYTVTHATGASGGDGFILEPVAVGENEQLGFRRTDVAEFACFIEPDATLTSPGDLNDPPAGESDDFSGECVQPLADLGGLSKMWIIELDDALFIMFTDSTNEAWEWGVHIGRVYTPFDANDADHGRDGLAVIVGEPSYSSTGSSWFSRSGSVSKVHHSRGDWGPLHVPEPGASRISEGEVRPPPISIRYYISSSLGPVLGAARYLRAWRVSTSALTRLESNDSDQAWSFLGPFEVIPWKRGVVP